MKNHGITILKFLSAMNNSKHPSKYCGTSVWPLAIME
jgi:hypothetical protein